MSPNRPVLSDDKDVSGACIIFNQESFSINPSFYNWPSGYSGWEKCEFNLMNINCFRNLKKIGQPDKEHEDTLYW